MSIQNNNNSTLLLFKFNEQNNFTIYSTRTPISNLMDQLWNMEASSITTIITPTIITDIEIITMYTNDTLAAAATFYNNNNNTTTSNVNSIEMKLIIPLYVIIFVLAILGNILVLVTLAQNKRMRTVTNVYLLNLALADFLLGVFCMPFTLIGQLLRNFIFGATVCKLIPYFQAVSVSVGVWTLVAISLERYCAICRPLKSRRWQTQFHAYKMIILVWISSLIWNSPILSVTQLKPIRSRVTERYKCREDWMNVAHERAYNLFLDVILLIIPLLIMSLAYFLIMRKLWKGLKVEIKHNSKYQQDTKKSRISSVKDLTAPNSELESQNHLIDSRYTKSTCSTCSRKSSSSFDKNRLRYESTMHNNSSQYNSNKLFDHTTSFILKSKSNSTLATNGSTRIQQKPFILIQQSTDGGCDKCFKSLTTASTITATSITDDSTDTTYTFNRHAIRSNYMDRSIDAKKKVIRMLFVIVAEFFICWTPIHVLNTWYLFDPVFIYKNVGPTGISLVHLLSYISSCCNPITYCFMNRRFRQAFLNVFYYNSLRKLCLTNKEKKHPKCHINDEIRNISEVSRNSTMLIDPTSNIGRSGKTVL